MGSLSSISKVYLPPTHVLNVPTAPQTPPLPLSPRVANVPASLFLAQINLVQCTGKCPLVGQDKYPLAARGRLHLADSSSSPVLYHHLCTISYALLACRKQHGPPSKTFPRPSVSPTHRQAGFGIQSTWNTHCPTVHSPFLWTSNHTSKQSCEVMSRARQLLCAPLSSLLPFPTLPPQYFPSLQESEAVLSKGEGQSSTTRVSCPSSPQALFRLGKGLLPISYSMPTAP